VQDLKANPPAPFDLSQRSRVFSTKFQFVEHEVRGAEWTERKVKLSSLLLNPDLPESVQDILETQVRPFQGHGDLECDVPGFLNGQPAFDAAGVRILVKVKQSEVVKQWTDIRTSYLRKLTGFGWLIRRDRVEAFRHDVAVFEQVLKVWVEAFKDKASRSRGDQVGLLVDAIVQRIPAARRNDLPRKAVEQQVADGLDRLRVIEPRVRIVFKDVAWESSRDDEFLAALEAALPAEELKGWFEEFAVVRQRQKGSE
jgi:hypothetical protein